MNEARGCVLHVITRLDPGGSAENTLLSVALANREHLAADLAYGPTAGDPGPTLERASRAGARLFMVPGLVRDLRPLADVQALWNLWRLMRRRRYRLVHTHTSKAGVLGRLAAWLARVPAVVHTPHGHVFYGYYGPRLSRFFVWTERRAARLADRIIALTAVDADEHVDFGIAGREKFAVIHSGVDFAPLQGEPGTSDECRRLCGLEPGTTVVGTVGRLTAIKGQDDLLRAFALLRDRFPRARLLLVGDGEEKEALRALARDLGIAKQVVFAGWRRDLAPVYGAMDVFAFPSLNEGMGKALVEAMFCGVASVATRVGGVPEVLQHGQQGLLVPPCDPQALAEAVAGLLVDGERRRRLGQAARERAGAYSAAEMVRQLEELYTEVLRVKGVSLL